MELENTQETNNGEAQQANNEGPPEAIPYGRFQEVNESKKAAEAQLEAERNRNEQLMNFLQTQANQPQVPRYQESTPQYDPFDEYERFQNDPRAYLNTIRTEIKQEVMNEVQTAYQQEKQFESAVASATSKYPALNKPNVKAMLQTFAVQGANNPALGHLTINQIVDQAANELNSMFTSAKTEGVTEGSHTSIQKQNSFVEGSHSQEQVPPRQTLSNYEQAKKAGDKDAIAVEIARRLREKQYGKR